MLSPTWKPLGTSITRSHVGQLTLGISARKYFPSFSLSLKVRFAQLEQSILSPSRRPLRDTLTPHPGQRRLLIPLPHRPNVPSSFPRSNPTMTSPSTIMTGVARRPIFWDQFFHGTGVLSYISIRKRDLVMRKKLFRRMARRSPCGRVNYDVSFHWTSFQLLALISLSGF